MSKMKWDQRNPFSPNGTRTYRQQEREIYHRGEVFGKREWIPRWEIHVSELREVVDEAKRRPCHDCKVSYPPYVLQFDHLDAKEKKFNISQYRTLLPSVEILKEEIAKCDLVCANCHAERTHRRSEQAAKIKAKMLADKRASERRIPQVKK